MRGGGLAGGLVATRGGGEQRGLFAGSFGIGGDPTDTFDARTALFGRQLAPLDVLKIAVVDKALRDFRMYRRCRDAKRREWWETARAFLFDPDPDVGWPFTFERICDGLDVDLDAARAAIQAKRGSLIRARRNVHRGAPVQLSAPKRPRPHVDAWVQLGLPLDVETGPPALVLVRPRRRRVDLHGAVACRYCLCAATTGDLVFERRRRLRRAA